MSSLRSRFLSAFQFTLASCLLIAAQAQEEIVRSTVKIDEMAYAAKETYTRAIGSQPIGTIQQVSYRGAPVMYEIDQRIDRRRVEMVIRYDGERLPISVSKRPKRIEKIKIDVAKLPAKVSAGAAKRLAVDAIEEVRQISYREAIIIYELDAGEQCHGFYIDGQLAFKAPRPATQPAEAEPEVDGDNAGEDGKGGDGAAGGGKP